MGLFSWLKGIGKKPPPRPAPRPAGPKPLAVEPQLGRSRHRPPGQKPRPYLVHLDATFDDDEHAAFLLGIRVMCRSTWVESARWNEETSTMTLWVDGKDYDFPGIDFEKADEFSKYFSKGRWYWEIWRKRGRVETEQFDIVKMGGREPGRR